ncbi:integral-membrane protein [Alloactinosynnema sp. L-07]|uniref:anthrone oxygenase family protein n=1 Tax=Alloactinosynnema sp. L-07 TaxID=1653480 RepID=UPI00065F00E9|nr:anthrone oxygenase family protein [Alloactinosynnema sp. L-07]CRK62112.1 integral-membrane protein [Alloactinosynnema sp. L-07]
MTSTGEVDQRAKGKLAGPLLWLATASVGVVAGVFYAFAISVMPGLAKTDDKAFIDSMQNINRSIENGAFGSAFLGSFIFTGAAAIIENRMGRRAAARWIIASLLLYVVGVAITMGINIPLNQKLEAAGAPANIADLAAVRAAFEDPWNSAHLARTVACVLALGCLGRALWLHGRAERADGLLPR